MQIIRIVAAILVLTAFAGPALEAQNIDWRLTGRIVHATADVSTGPVGEAASSIEAGSGMTEGAMWRRVALAFDGPGTQALPREPGLLATARRSETVTDADGRQALLVTGGRWETVLTGEQGVVDLGGAIDIEWGDQGRPAGIRNGLDIPVTNAGLLFRNHSYHLGRIEPGARVVLPPEVDALWKQIGSVTDAGIPAEDVGPMVSEAILEGRFWLLPNGEQFFEVFDHELAELKAGR